jgi:hypothetical protein
MNTVSGSSELLEVGRVFGLECARLDRKRRQPRQFLIATVELQKKGQVAANKSLTKFLTATKTVFSLKRRFVDFHFTNVSPCGTRCGKT